MNAQSLEALEYPEVRRLLAAEASTPQGAALARALLPSPDPDEVARRQARTGEAIELDRLAAVPGLAGATAIAEHAQRAAQGGTLELGSLRAIASTVALGLAAVEAARRASEHAPLLAELVEPVEPGLASLAAEIDRCVEADGSAVRDSASLALRGLRRELRDGRARAADELRRLARSPGVREHLQEDFVTERAGRPVLALRADARGRVPGIVHDTSASGQTLFVEPFAIVEANNLLRELVGRERDEVERIVAALTVLVGDRVAALVALEDAIGGLDLAFAGASLARRWRAVEVAVGDDVELVAARHPLLDAALAVPIDLELGSVKAVVISGPNTGGKTVALKTLGLAALLHQSGLRVPAARVSLPVFDHVLADIGDAQSIAMSLSTFSGHLRNLIAILERASERSLVLLDEVAAGTDPVEGAALAQALLARLTTQARLTLATSHYAELKEWASATAGAANAATGFDSATHAPLYRIALGRPGTSHALQIAERLGLDPGLAADARARIDPARRRIGDLLAEAEHAEQDAAEDRRAAAGEREDAARRAVALREREQELLAEIEHVRAGARLERERAIAEAERDLADARRELEGLRDEVRAARRAERERRHDGGAPRRADERERDRRLGAADAIGERVETTLRTLADAPGGSVALAAGDAVVAPTLGLRGTIAAIEGDEAVVDGDRGLRVRVDLARLRPASAAAPPAADAPPTVRLADPQATVVPELDVRGRRALDARDAVREYVDAASLAGLVEVRVVHGRGTGAVRAAVREELSKHPLVDAFETDANDGASVVRLGGA